MVENGVARSFRRTLQTISDCYDMRSEIYTSDAQCAENLAMKAKAALLLLPKELEGESHD